MECYARSLRLRGGEAVKEKDRIFFWVSILGLVDRGRSPHVAGSPSYTPPLRACELVESAWNWLGCRGVTT